MKGLMYRTIFNFINPIENTNSELRSPEYTIGGIRCLGGVSIPNRPVTRAVSPIARPGKRNNLQSKLVCRGRSYNWYEAHQTAFDLMGGCTRSL
jgi:hypothetical protein